MRSTGAYVSTTTLGEPVRAFVPRPLPPARPVLAPESYEAGARAAELALARLSVVAAWCHRWSGSCTARFARRRCSPRRSRAEATLTDLFDDEAGLAVAIPTTWRR